MAIPDVELTQEQERLVRDGAVLALKAFQTGSTDSRRALARLLVDLRETCTDEEGRKDYRAQSGVYKAAAARLYDLTGLNKEQREKLRWSVQHHVSNELFRRLGEEGSVAYGLADGRNVKRQKRRQSPPTGAQMATEARRERERAELIEQSGGAQHGCGLVDLTPDLAREIRADLAAVVTLYGTLIARLDVFLAKADA